MKTGFEESRELNPPLGSLVAGRYEVNEWLGQAAFSTALQCTDTSVPEDDAGEHPAPESFSSGALGSAALSRARDGGDWVRDDHGGKPEPRAARHRRVCLKLIKNNKDFLDQSLDEIKLLRYINASGDPDEHHVLRLLDFFYWKEHLIIVSELLRENLYEWGKQVQRFLPRAAHAAAARA